MMEDKDMLNTGHTVVGVFEDVSQAEQAINDLKVAGFTPDSISVLTKDRQAQTAIDETLGNEAGQGALVGSLGGGTLGAVLGWLLAGGTALIPGIGPVVAAGVFGATLGGALIGGAVGGLSGALAGAGVPEEEAGEYTEHVKTGRTLVTVNAANGRLLEAAVDVFERNGAISTRYYDLGQTGPGRSYVRNTTGDLDQPYATTREEQPLDTTNQMGDTSATGSYSTSESADDRDNYSAGSSLGEEQLDMGDISTLPDRNTGTSTRGGIYNDRPGSDMLPDRPDRNDQPPRSI